MRTIDEALESPSHDLPEWLEEFIANLVYAEASATIEAPTSTSCEPLH